MDERTKLRHFIPYTDDACKLFEDLQNQGVLKYVVVACTCAQTANMWLEVIRDVLEVDDLWIWKHCMDVKRFNEKHLGDDGAYLEIKELEPYMSQSTESTDDIEALTEHALRLLSSMVVSSVVDQSV